MPRKLTVKQQAKVDDDRISSAYSRSCSGLPIDIMLLSKVSAVGHASIACGDDDATLGTKLRAFVETIR